MGVATATRQDMAEVALERLRLAERMDFGYFGEEMTKDRPEYFLRLAREQGASDGRGMTIELCGVCTDICVVSNALLIKAALPEADLRVQGSLCAGVTPGKHEAALETLRSCQVEVL